MTGAVSLPDPETIRRTAEEVVQRPDYRLEPLGEGGKTFLDLFLGMIEWLLTPLSWLFGALDGLPEWLRWLIVAGLLVLLLALVAHIIYAVVTALRGPTRSARARALSEPRHLDPGLPEREAEAAAAAGDYIGAIRLLFRACLLRLAAGEKRAFRPALTNREYLRRYRGTPVFDGMSLFVETIDCKWYGGAACAPTDYKACRDAHGRIRGMSGGTAYADGA
ncbi:MAG: hypothetical protein HQ581_15560 [Planctomycetes bacterium]|nr:hypothetical protein [Planctomycetota bacterium]